MVAFRLEQPTVAPPEFVVRWWLDYSSDDPQLTNGIVHRTVERVDENHTRLSTTSDFGGRPRTTEGVVTRTGPTTWKMEGQVVSSGAVVSTMRTLYSVEPEVTGSRVVADFEFLGNTFAWRLAIGLSGYSLRRRQRQNFRDYAAAIERDYAAERRAEREPNPAPTPPPAAPPLP
jgi:hypothetical protein